MPVAPGKVVELLNVALTEGDADLLTATLRCLIYAHGIAELAREVGLDCAPLYEAIRSGDAAHIGTMRHVCAALSVDTSSIKGA